VRGPTPQASTFSSVVDYAQLASSVSNLSAVFLELLRTSDLPADLALQVRETKSKCDELVASCESSTSALSEYVVHALGRLDEVPSLLEKPSRLRRRLRSVRGDIDDIQERLSRQERACSDAESSIQRLTSLLKSFASKARDDKTNSQIGAVIAGVMCLGLAAYAIPAMLAGGTAASGAAAAGSSALVAETSAAAATAVAAESAVAGAGAAAAAAEGAAGFAAGAMAAEGATAAGVAAAAAEGTAAAAFAGSAMAGASAMALREGANGCDDLICLLSLQIKDLESQRRGVQDAVSTCQDLVQQVALASRDYGDAEDAFGERDLEDLVDFVNDTKKRLTGLMGKLRTHQMCSS